MFEDVDMKKWRAEFHYKNTNEVMLKLKYSNAWYFPIMLFTISILLFGFTAFVIGFFLLKNGDNTAHILYSASVIAFILFWCLIYFFIQRMAVHPYTKNAEGYLVLTEKKFTTKKLLKDKTSINIDHKYSEVKHIYFNKKTCALAIVSRNKTEIFNQIMLFDDIPDILNILYKMTKIKPEIV